MSASGITDNSECWRGHGAPNLINATKFVFERYAGGTDVCIDGRWVPARHLGWQGWVLRHRLKLAWRVFIGRYDALEWDGQ